MRLHDKGSVGEERKTESREQNVRAEKRNKERVRRHAEDIRSLLRIYGNRCFWCGEALVAWEELCDTVSHFPAHVAIIRKHQDTVLWSSPRGLVRAKLATKDHVIPLSKGGNNRLGNLVPSCASCNRKKGDAKYSSSYRGRSICPRCGGAKRLTSHECAACRRKRKT